MAVKKILAMDYGAGSGRGIIGEFDGSSLSLREVHRFSNDPVIVGNSMHWDVLRLFHELKQTLVKCEAEGGVDSLAVDTWGVDYGLIDENGELLGNPFHYRDERTKGLLPEMNSQMSLDEIYEITGINPMEINTLTQLYAAKRSNLVTFEMAEKILLMPDLLNYFLSGEKRAEYSIASTTQIMDARTGKWADRIIESFGFKKTLFPEIVPSGSSLGFIRDSIVKELSIKRTPKVVCACGHDTGDAMVGVPAKEEDFLFISCGTWALFGTELSTPIINEDARARGFSNEGGFGGKTSFLKNIVGTWLIQESRRQWQREGKDYSFGELEALASKENIDSIIDTNDSVFTPAGDMPNRIREYCRARGMAVPETPGQVVRVINLSLAHAYKNALEEISTITGKTYKKIYMVGGGTQSKLLCRLTADITGIPLVAGPVESTVIGNLLCQLIAEGEIRDLSEARELVRNLPDIVTYEPRK